MNLSLNHVRKFHAAVRGGSLLAGARQLGLTQPTVGRQIDLLEEMLMWRSVCFAPHRKIWWRER